ncbi:MAG: TatD family hydrolase [Promethearchaeota archaeon]
MGKKLDIPEPTGKLPFIDTHCHVPWTERSRTNLPTPDEQLDDFKNAGGKLFIVSSIDMKSARILLDFSRKNEDVYFSCGMAPQTVTYTKKQVYEKQFDDWKLFVNENIEYIISFGEIGLDFHHAKTLPDRRNQINELKKVLQFITDNYADKPIVLHVRNAGANDIDPANPTHQFNNKDSATMQILKIIKQFKIPAEKVLFHCYSGPESINELLVQQGFWFSVPSSAFSFWKWYKVSRNIPITRLMTETDSPFQHPKTMKPVNTPKNARYAVAAIAHSHGLELEKCARATMKNAIKFFGLKR